MHGSEFGENGKNVVRGWKFYPWIKIMPKVTWILPCISCFPTRVIDWKEKRCLLCGNPWMIDLLKDTIL